MKTYWYPHEYNVGDTLTPHILRHFRPDIEIEPVAGTYSAGKLIGVGSIMRMMRPGDTIFGSGVMRETDLFPFAPSCTFLAVRGKLSRDILIRNGGKVPEVYGDPALLLPRIYSPRITKTHRVGLVPHYVDKNAVKAKFERLAGYKVIDVALPWRSFVDELLSCETIVSSSLHGIIIAEAYGLPAEWVEYSDKVIGKGFKFRDYLTGTNRGPQGVGKFPPIIGLEETQDKLIEALNKLSTLSPKISTV